MTEQAKCPTCNSKLTTGASINGKPKYFCINQNCPDRFKTTGKLSDLTPNESRS